MLQVSFPSITNRFASLDVEDSSQEEDEKHPINNFLIGNKSLFQTVSQKSALKHKKREKRKKEHSMLNPDCLTVSEKDDNNKQDQEDKWLKPRDAFRTKKKNETLSLGYKMDTN